MKQVCNLKINIISSVSGEFSEKRRKISNVSTIVLNFVFSSFWCQKKKKRKKFFLKNYSDEVINYLLFQVCVFWQNIFA